MARRARRAHEEPHPVGTAYRQRDALTQAGCDRLFTATFSGAKADRPSLTEVLAYARPGDALVVWRLDRRGRSPRHLIETRAACKRAASD